jgi:hypothetical protein
MDKRFTLNDLDRYQDEVTRQSLNFSSARSMKPGKQVLRNLMNYSNALTIFKSGLTGNVSILLN